MKGVTVRNWGLEHRRGDELKGLLKWWKREVLRQFACVPGERQDQSGRKGQKVAKRMPARKKHEIES